MTRTILNDHRATCPDCRGHTFEHILRIPSGLIYVDLWQCRGEGCRRVFTQASQFPKPSLLPGEV